MDRLMRSMLKDGTLVHVQRDIGGEGGGGYYDDVYADPEIRRVVLRPGSADIRRIQALGREGTGDWRMWSPAEYDITPDSRVTFPVEETTDTDPNGVLYPDTNTYYAEATDAEPYLVGQPEPCLVTGVRRFALRETTG